MGVIVWRSREYTYSEFSEYVRAKCELSKKTMPSGNFLRSAYRNYDRVFKENPEYSKDVEGHKNLLEHVFRDLMPMKEIKTWKPK